MQNQLEQIAQSLSFFWPEAYLSIAFVGLIVLGLWRPTFLKPQYWWGLLLVLLALLGYATVLQFQSETNVFLFGQMLFLDNKAIFFKLLICLSGIVMALHGFCKGYAWPDEFFSVWVGMLLGLYLMTMAVNLLSIYVTIELVSIPSYILTAFPRDKRASEGGIKYLLFGAVASAIMLYGMSLLYGLTGTLNLTDVLFAERFGAATPAVQGLMGLLVAGGMLFKISAVPFHAWNPDVYEAAPTPLVSFFSVAPKLAGFLLLIRFLSLLNTNTQTVVGVVALASIGIGNLSALWQGNAKRLMAYSSIAQSGFMLLGLVAFTALGIKATVFYLATYLFANMGVFLILDLLLPDNQTDTNTIKQLSGLGSSQPLLAVALLVCMISLVGLPLTVGFSAKVLVFSALYEVYQIAQNPLLLALLLWALFNTAIGLFYYLKIPFVLFFREKINEHSSEIVVPLWQKMVVIALVLPVIVLFVKADWVLGVIEKL